MAFRLINLLPRSLPTFAAKLRDNAEKVVLSSIGIVGVIAAWEIA